ncbi:MAG: hypothetical protein H6546_02830 [Chitinophagales bacterium]|nr:hypothetical protein [Chitinophagales bacterium]
MNHNTFRAALRADGFEVEEFNSNNGWGFGGAAGHRYRKDDMVVTIATASYRHHPPVPFVKVTKDGETLLDMDRSANAFSKAFDIIFKK